MTKPYDPIDSLKAGNWFKLICGASFQHLPAVRNLVLAYSLAGADCIDVAADRAVITTAKAARAAASRCGSRGEPWLMVSLNDGEDPHFRKAQFNPQQCYRDCWQPCQTICPAAAIDFKTIGQTSEIGVIAERCYGCGRCLPVCPVEIITTRATAVKKAAIGPEIIDLGIEAIEIHTSVGNETKFQQLWQAIAPELKKLKLISISCGDSPGVIQYLQNLAEIISPLPIPLVWQTDGRPMSGDIGAGTTHATIKLARKVIAAGLPGYVQLAGGTNHATVSKIKALGLLPNSQTAAPKPEEEKYIHSPAIAGIAYGSYARTLLGPVLEKLERVEAENKSAPAANTLALERYPELLCEATLLAESLVSQLKDSQKNLLFAREVVYKTTKGKKTNI